MVDVDTSTGLGDIGDLYQVHGARVWRAVYGYTGDRDVTSDAVAEAFAQCMGRGKDVATPLPWIWRAAFRIAAGELKRRGAHAPLQDTSYEMDLPDPDLAAALAGLPLRMRAVVILHYYGGYRAPEIAEILGSSAATVRVQLLHARRKLRSALGERHG